MDQTPHTTRLDAPSAILLAGVFVLVAFAGCLGTDEPAAAVTPDDPPPFPAPYTIPDAERLAQDETGARYRWTGTAGMGADQDVDAQLTAPPELSLPIPPAIPLALYVEMRYPGRAEVWLALDVVDEAGEGTCPVAPERMDGDIWLNRCGTGVGPLETEETWRVRVRAMANVDPTVPFTVEIRWRVVLPETLAPVAPDAPIAYEPHVLVGLTDSGVNPYHEVYYRPERTAHPCTYVAGYSCDVPALNLSIGIYDDYWTAVAADQQIWDSVQADTWYWIPQTNLVAVHCAEKSRWRPACILDQDGHGTATSSSIVQENPDALIAITMGDAEDMPYLYDAPFRIDLVSFSWAPTIPLIVDEDHVYLGDCQSWVEGRYTRHGTLFVGAAGNRPDSTLIDCATGNPNMISVGGASAADRSQSSLTKWHPDVVSYVCRPAALAMSLDESWNPCGTSLGTPTVAGGLSKVILEVRRASGYTGPVRDGVLDPVLGITNDDLRHAMNHTATYDPEVHHGNTMQVCVDPAPACVPLGVPLNDFAPWHQWGWGFYDHTVANQTIAHLLGTDLATKPPGAVQWMATQHMVKRSLWGT